MRTASKLVSILLALSIAAVARWTLLVSLTDRYLGDKISIELG